LRGQLSLRRLGAIGIVALAFSGAAMSQGLSAATHGQRPPGLTGQTAELVEPIKLFDNLYYVGTTFVSAYLLTTSEGLILIDSLHDDFTAGSLEQIESLGFDLDDIHYVLISHGHADHFGGAHMVKQRTGARVAMSEADWAMAERVDRARAQPPERDVVYADGDTLTLGNTTIRFYVTPGHTPGVLSMEFTVYDDGRPHKAFLFGGHNVTLRTGDVAGAVRNLIATVERLQHTLEDVDVNLVSHPWAGLIFQRAEQLAERGPSDPHPFVDARDFRAFLQERLETHQSRLVELQ